LSSTTPRPAHQLNARRLPERHGEIRVEAATFVHQGGIYRVTKTGRIAEEIDERAIDAGCGLAVPVSAQKQIPVELQSLRHGEVNHRDGRRALDLCHDDAFR